MQVPKPGSLHEILLSSVQSRAQALALLRTTGDMGLVIGAAGAGAIANIGSMALSMESLGGMLATFALWFGSRTVMARKLWK